MSSVVNLTPPPLSTPIIDPALIDPLGTPWEAKGSGVPSGELTVAWAGWFNILFKYVLAIISTGGSPSGIYQMGSSGNLVPVLTAWMQQTSTLGGASTMTGNCTLKPPSTTPPGQTFMVQLIQDATGGRTIAFDAFYTAVDAFVLDTTASTQASLLFQINLAGTAAVLIDNPQNGWSIV